MFTGLTPLFRTALAWSVLAGAPGDPLPPYDEDLAGEVRRLARHYQLVDASTVWSYFTHEHFWARHANTLRAHAVELRPCPVLEECCFLPPYALCAACLGENKQYELWLQQELRWGGPAAPGCRPPSGRPWSCARSGSGPSPPTRPTTTSTCAGTPCTSCAASSAAPTSTPAGCRHTCPCGGCPGTPEVTMQLPLLVTKERV